MNHNRYFDIDIDNVIKDKDAKFCAAPASFDMVRRGWKRDKRRPELDGQFDFVGLFV